MFTKNILNIFADFITTQAYDFERLLDIRDENGIEGRIYELGKLDEHEKQNKNT